MPDRLYTNIVPPDGPLDSAICWIGGAPGETEDRRLQPFKGSAGQFHNRCMAKEGLIRKEQLFTNIFMQQPPKNEVNYYYQDKYNTRLTWEGEEHLEILRLWLEKLKLRPTYPNLIVALGVPATYHLTGKIGMNKWRGSILPCTLVPGFKVYITFHPSHVQRLINEPSEALYGERKRRQQNVLPLFMFDIQRIIEQSHSKELTYPERKFDLNLPYGELMGKLAMIRHASMISVDIETFPRPEGPIIWMIGFAPSPEYAFVVPILQNLQPAHTIEHEARLWQAISKVFLDPDVLKIFQGGLYDLSILGRYYGLRCAPGTYADTMWCHHATYPTLPKALHVLTSIYTWEPYYKDAGKINLGSSTDESESVYNCKDTTVTREIYPILTRSARENATWDGYMRTMGVMPSILAMMLRGIRIDLEKKEALSHEFRKKAIGYQTKLNQSLGSTWDIASSVQMKILLYTELALPAMEHFKTGRLTADADALYKLKKRFPKVEILDFILGYRKYAKLSNTYADMAVDTDGRIHTSYGFVSTWRLSSSESPFGSGGNLQNIPVRSEEGRMIRQIFISDLGKVLLASDLSQAEARVVAYEAGDMRQIKLFKEGWDIHWESTKMLFSLEPELVFESNALYQDPITGESFTHKELRDIGKPVKHAGNYGMGWMKLQGILLGQGFPFKASVCKDLMGRHARNNPFITTWQQSIRDEVRTTKTLISSYGRKREFLGRLNDNLYRSAYAFSPQNTVGEMLEVAIQRIEDEVEYVDVLLNVHDEVVCQLDPKDVPRAIKAITAIMETPIQVRDRTMPAIVRELVIPCDFKIGHNWGQMTADIGGFLDELRT